MTHADPEGRPIGRAPGSLSAIFGACAAMGLSGALASAQWLTEGLEPLMQSRGCGGCPIPIERVMREFQGRYEFVMGETVEWPPAKCGGRSHPGIDLPAPPYPPDGFYGDALCDPRLASRLVGDLFMTMYSAHADGFYDLGRFRSESGIRELADGEEVPEDWEVTFNRLFPNGLVEVTPENYCEVLHDLWETTQTMQWIELGVGGGSGVPGYGGDVRCSASGHYCIVTDGGGPPAPCYATCLDGYIDFAQAIGDCFSAPPDETTTFEDIGIWQVAIYMPNGCDWEGELDGCSWDTLTFYRFLGSAEVEIGSQRGRGHAFLKIGGDAVDGDMGYNRPPGPIDSLFHKYGTVDGPIEWERLIHGDPYGIHENLQGERLPPNGDLEWRVEDRMIAVFEPRYQRLPDRVVSPDACSECEPGRVEAELSGVNVRIRLGTWRGGEAGYLLIRGDTLVGWGDELLEARQGNQAPLVGRGAAELGRPASVLCRVPIENGEGFRVIRTQSGVLRQVKFPLGLAVIEAVNNTQYTVTFYSDGVLDEGEYVPVGEPFHVVTVSHAMSMEENAETPADDDYLITGSLTVEESLDGGEPFRTTRYAQTVEVTDWTVLVDDPDNKHGGTQEEEGTPFEIQRGFLPAPHESSWVSGHTVWTLETGIDGSGNAARREVVDEVASGASRTQVRSVFDGSWLIHRESRHLAVAPGGAEWPVSYAVYPDGETAQSAAVDIETDPEYEGLFFTVTKGLTDRYGRWERYEYDEKGRVTKVISQFQDREVSEEDNRVVEFGYYTIDLLDDGTNPEHIVERVERLEGREIARTYTIYWMPGDPPGGGGGGGSSPTGTYPLETSVVRCATPGDPGDLATFLNTVMADPLGSVHLVTHTRTHNPGPWLDGWTDGKLASVLSEDGVVAVYDYWVGQLHQNYGFEGEVGTVSRVQRGPISPGSPASPVGQEQQPHDGERTITVKGEGGVLLLRQAWDMQGDFEDGGDLQYGGHGEGDILLSESRTVERDDPFGRATKVAYLDGTFIETGYACCGVESEADREGVTTTYVYDILRRVWLVTRATGETAATTTRYVYDAEGRVLETVRIGEDNSEIVTSVSVYDMAGRLVLTEDALGNRTTYEEEIDLENGRVVRTTIFPDPDGEGPLDAPFETSVHYPDGSLEEQTGAAVVPMKLEYGVEEDTELGQDVWVVWTKQVAIGEGASESEWVKTYADALGRPYRTLYPDDAETRSWFDGRGRLVKDVDPDGVTMLHAQGHGQGDAPAGAPQGGWEGEWRLTVVDMDRDGEIDFDGTDRITRTTRRVLNTDDFDESGADVVRSVTTVWTTEGVDDATLDVSLHDTATDGLRSWSSSFGLASRTETVYDRQSRSRTDTTTNPDGTSSVAVTRYGRQDSVTTHPADPGEPPEVHTRATFAYDAHGRLGSVTEWRGEEARTTTFTYDDADRQLTVTTPAPGPELDPQTTEHEYDGLGRVVRTTLPDATEVLFEYFPTGALKRSWGSRTYPTEYTYDPQGRLRTLTTWQEFDFEEGEGIDGDATTTWNYDPQRGRLVSKVYEGGGTDGPAYEYWPSGRLKKRTWTRGVETEYGYDEGGILATIDYSDDTPGVAYTFDRRGLLVGVTDAVGTREFTYTVAGLPTVEDFTDGVLDTVRIENAYDALLRREMLEIRVDNTLRNEVAFAYEEGLGRLLSVSKAEYGAEYVAEYGYVPHADLVASVSMRRNANALAEGVWGRDGLDRLRSLSWDSAGGPDEGYEYAYNGANQRTRLDLADGSSWAYGYDALGQVASGKRSWPDESLVPGQQFEYAFDAVGNRTAARFGGDEEGENLREVVYASNLLNQYVQRGVSSGVDIMGYAPEQSTVTVNGLSAYRFVEFFQRLVSWANDAAARYEEVLIGIDPGDDETRMVFLPRTPEAFTHDADGGLLSDGRWVYEWDGENRLSAMETRAGLPSGVPVRRVEFTYDFLGRRCVKRVYGPDPTPVGGGVQNAGSGGLTGPGGTPAPGPNPQPTWSLISTTKFVWDGWTVAAELDGNDAVVRTFAWGADVSGREQGAGGVGGLLFQTEGPNGPTRHALYDGNGNVTSMRDDAGAVAAAFEYGPFGETLTARGDAVGSTPFRFSTKYTDPESGLLYYGHRYYNPSTGRWLSRDPIEEHDGPNLYAFVGNEPVGKVDALGMWKYVPGRGTFSGSLGPVGDLGRFSLSSAEVGRSDFELSFDTQTRLFKDSCAPCTEVRFIQTYYFEKKEIPIVLNLRERRWTLDSGGGSKPWYPHGIWRDPAVGPSLMSDRPGVQLNWVIKNKLKTPSMSMLFETCAVCSRGAARGEVYGCIFWGHAWIYNAYATRPPEWDWTRNVAGLQWGNHLPTVVVTNTKQKTLRTQYLGGPALRNPGGSDTYRFNGILGTPPSAPMMDFLAEYFPGSS